MRSVLTFYRQVHLSIAMKWPSYLSVVEGVGKLQCAWADYWGAGRLEKRNMGTFFFFRGGPVTEEGKTPEWCLAFFFVWEEFLEGAVGFLSFSGIS